MDRIANVFFNGRLAGTLKRRSHAYEFKYSSNYLAGGTPLSFHLPLQEDPFVSKELFSFFENLASEGWLKKTQSREQKIDENDRFGLLIANGKDLIGAVTVEQNFDRGLRE